MFEIILPGQQAEKEKREACVSLVRVSFLLENAELNYYNDQFDLHEGDIVYVEGKYAGTPGRVTKVFYSFKIRRSEYKRVIFVADTEVHGRFYMAGSHFVTLDPHALPIEKVITWFRPPIEEDETYITVTDDRTIDLLTLEGLVVSPKVLERGVSYYKENLVKYLCIDGNTGTAIVEGSNPYEVEFVYENGTVKQLVCNCLCIETCKHEVAALMQLRETLAWLNKQNLTETDYFATVFEPLLIEKCLAGKREGMIEL
ncbi:MAG: hypothetical protein IJP30_01510 [Clostridia bacterium]|nr:hypothetical protein [Clostridia bacterium]